jgi:5-methyltetrahydrofolate--homocysteine methyltransferase
VEVEPGPGVLLVLRGVGKLTGTEEAPRLTWEARTVEVDVESGRGIDLAVQTAEAAAEYLHRHIRRELGLPDRRGKRYSWGYPAIPDLEDHTKVFKLLPAEQALGMSLSPAFQLIPEQSTAAIIIHHPAAKYYSVGARMMEHGSLQKG